MKIMGCRPLGYIGKLIRLPLWKGEAKFNQYWGESAFRDSPFLFACFSAAMNIVALPGIASKQWVLVFVEIYGKRGAVN